MQFESLKSRQLPATIMLGVMLCFVIVDIYFVMMTLDFLDRAEAGLVMSDAEGAALEMQGLIISLCEVGAYILSAVFFVRWMLRAYGNLPSISTTPPEFSGGQVGWAFFIPILNFFRPYQVMTEIWRGTFKDRGTGLVTMWWLLWLVASVCGRALARSEPATIPDLRSNLTQTIVCEVVRGVCAILAIRVVLEITRGQDQHTKSQLADTFS